MAPSCLRSLFWSGAAHGEVIVPIPGPPTAWSEVPFGDAVQVLDGVAGRIRPPEPHRSGKAIARAVASDAATDLADFRALSGL